MAKGAIKIYLDKQTKTDLQYADPDPTKGSNLVDLTEAIVGQVVGLLLQRKTHREIRKEVKLPNPKAAGALTLSLSRGQIKDIESKMTKRIAVLNAPEPKPELDPVEVPK